MARMLPPRFPRGDDPRRSAERQVFEAFARLDDDWTVIYSQPYVGSRSTSHRLVESGEIDFVLLHRTFGALSVEVKGGAISVSGNQWFSRDSRGEQHAIKNPFEVASDGARRILGALRETLPVNRTSNCSNHCVVFPGMLQSEDITLDGPSQIVLSRNDLAEPTKTVSRVVNFWGQKPGWTEQEFRAVREAIVPNKKIPGASYGEVLQILEELERLTDQQRAVVRTLASGSGAIVLTGGAGTGKTLLGMGHAIKLAQAGKRVLFVCATSSLARFLVREHENLSDDVKRNLEIEEARVYTNRVISRFQAERTEGPKGSVRESERLDRFLEAVAFFGLENSLDCIVLDEAQDIRLKEREMLEFLLKPSSEGGLLLIMGDPNQQLSIQRSDSALEHPSALRRSLDVNCRNTLEIAKVAHRFTSTDVEVREGIKGIKIREVRTKGLPFDAVLEEANRIRAEYNPDSLVVLTINGATDLADKPEFLDKGRGVEIPINESGGALDEDVQSFKIRTFQGQEADAVIAVLRKETLRQTYPFLRFEPAVLKSRNPRMRAAADSDFKRVRRAYDEYSESAIRLKSVELSEALFETHPDLDVRKASSFLTNFKTAKEREFVPNFRHPLLIKEWKDIQERSWRILLYSIMTRARVVLSVIADDETWRFIREGASDLLDLEQYMSEIDLDPEVQHE